MEFEDLVHIKTELEKLDLMNNNRDLYLTKKQLKKLRSSLPPHLKSSITVIIKLGFGMFLGFDINVINNRKEK